MQQVTAEELPRLQRAVVQAPDYTLERLGGTNSYWIRKPGSSHLTSEATCTCEDFQAGNGEGKPLRRCKHCFICIAALSRDGRVTPAVRKAAAQSFRSLWG